MNFWNVDWISIHLSINRYYSTSSLKIVSGRQACSCNHQIFIRICFWSDKLNQSRNSETAMLSIARMYFLNLVVLSALLLPMFGGLCEKVEKGKHNCLQTQNSDQLIKMEALRIWRIISLLWYVVLPDHQFRTLLFCEILVGALGCHAFNSQRKV